MDMVGGSSVLAHQEGSRYLHQTPSPKNTKLICKEYIQLWFLSVHIPQYVLSQTVILTNYAKNEYWYSAVNGYVLRNWAYSSNYSYFWSAGATFKVRAVGTVNAVLLMLEYSTRYRRSVKLGANFYTKVTSSKTRSSPLRPEATLICIQNKGIETRGGSSPSRILYSIISVWLMLQSTAAGRWTKGNLAVFGFSLASNKNGIDWSVHRY